MANPVSDWLVAAAQTSWSNTPLINVQDETKLPAESWHVTVGAR